MFMLPVKDYIEQAGIPFEHIDVSRIQFWVERLQEEPTRTYPEDTIFTYKIPKLGEGGSCSLFGELEDKPFRLDEALNDFNQESALYIAQLKTLIDVCVEASNIDWLGIYQARSALQENHLLKLAYHGAPSRPVFPLNDEFAQISNNTQVGLSGKAKVIQNVEAYLKEGGGYYTCDPKVKSEICLPLFSTNREIVGIIDAEAFSCDFFNKEILSMCVALCCVAPLYLPKQ